MRAVIQRVSQASVQVGEERVGQIGPGLLILLGVEEGDSEEDLSYIVQKTMHLRIFPDENEKMNLSLQDTGGAVLVVSQFTLLGDARKGRRPGFTRAAAPEIANAYFEKAIQAFKEAGIPTQQGRFMTDMQVSLCNQGPTTILLDSRKLF